MSIVQPLPEVVPDDDPDDDPDDVPDDVPDDPPVGFDSVELAFDSVELVVLEVSVVFFVSLPEPALSAVVDVRPESPSELDESLFEPAPAFEEPRLSVL
jgi:hypothetical protein